MITLTLLLQTSEEVADETKAFIGIVTAILLIVGGIFYFLPSIIALLKSKTNAIAIIALNFFLGWTLVGWVVSLVWSLSSDIRPQRIIINQDKAIQENEYETLEKLKKLLDDGAITKEEYNNQKMKLLK